MSFSDELIIAAGADSSKAANALLAMRIVRNYTRAFFDKTLRARTETALDRPTGADSSNVSVESFQPGSVTARSSDRVTNLLPPPTGPTAIGRVTYHWTDSSRVEIYTTDPRAHRELMVDVWYPAQQAGGRPRASYLPELPLLRRVLGDTGLRRGQFAPIYAAIEAGRLLTHAVEGVPARCGKQGCPVLVFSHGGGVDRSSYTAQYEEYASHGYVVVAVAHAYNTHVVVFPDGRVVRTAPRRRDTMPPDLSIPYWLRQSRAIDAEVAKDDRIAAEDVRFVVDKLTAYARDPALAARFGRQLDLERIGALGHSFGGRVASQACQIDRRIKACLNQDGTARRLPFWRDSAGRTMQQPFLYFGRVEPMPRPSTDSVLKALELTRAEEDSMYRARPLEQTALLADVPAGSWRLRLTTPDAKHFSFTDELIIGAGDDSTKTANALLALRVVRAYTVAFFDKTLRGRTGTLLDRQPAADTSLVSIERFGPARSAKAP